MQPDILKEPAAKAPWSVIHPLSEEDSAAVAALRSVVAPMKGKLEGTAGRGPFNSIMERVAVPEGVTFEAATVAGISGWWAKPAKARKGAAIIHVHGGWFNWGTAQAFRNFAGHIASSAGADAFIPDYRLAPEHPFPAAIRDLEACYRGLVDHGTTKIALTGDSAGGNLALVLLSIASAQVSESGFAPAGAVVFSPITDLALTGESFDTRAEADPFFTKAQVRARPLLSGRNRSEESAGIGSLRGAERTTSYPGPRWRRRGAARRFAPLRRARCRGRRRRQAGCLDGNATRVRHQCQWTWRGYAGTQRKWSISNAAAGEGSVTGTTDRRFCHRRR